MTDSIMDAVMLEKRIEEALKEYCTLINSKVISAVFHDSQLNNDDPYVKFLGELSKEGDLSHDGIIASIKRRMNFLNHKLSQLRANDAGNSNDDMHAAIADIKDKLAALKKRLILETKVSTTVYPTKMAELDKALSEALVLADKLDNHLITQNTQALR